MTLTQLLAKYIDSTDQVLRNLRINPVAVNTTPDKTREILSWAKNYLQDAKHYKMKKKLGTSLIAVAYSEGLLDALRLIGAVDFEWPQKTTKNKKTRTK